jgi:hypothetical protein
MKKQVEEISIVRIPINKPKELALSMVEDDRALIHAICEYSKQLRKDNIEVFKREKNVIATEAGYFFAMYEKDKVMVESGLFNPENEKDGHE